MSADKFESPCIYFNLRKATRLMGQIYDRHFRQVGLKGTQYSLLMAIDRLGGPNIGDLSQALGLEQSTVTRNIELLIRNAFVEARPEPNDNRIKVLILTRAGKKKIKEALPFWQAAQADLIGRLGEKDSDRLIRMHNRLIAVLKQ